MFKINRGAKSALLSLILTLLTFISLGFEEVIVADEAKALPSKYSSLDAGIVTSVKNQGSYGTCWAFSTISCAETYMIKNKMIDVDKADFSEQHLAYFTYHPAVDIMGGTAGDGSFLTSSSPLKYMQVGGNYYLSMSTLANWMGLVDESVALYAKDTSLDEDKAYKYDLAHLEDAIMIPMSKTDVIKENIIKYGAAGISYYSYNPFYNESKTNYYYPYVETDDSFYGEGHSVTIVGWDDNYAKENFKNVPASDGAWLIKNSWGENNNDNGYFWLSYCDNSIEKSATFFSFGDSDNYDIQYQYDGTISKTLTFYTDDTCADKTTVANVFAASQEQYLKAVSFYTYTDDIEYSVQIYTGLEQEAKPNEGTLAYEQPDKAKLPFSGYHTIKLDKDIRLKAGERFSVVVTLYGDAKFPFEDVNFSSADNNQTYIYTKRFDSLTGQWSKEEWFDIKDYEEYNAIADFYSKPLFNSNARIKAFVDNISENEQNVDNNSGNEENKDDNSGNEQIEDNGTLVVERNPYIVNIGQKLSDSQFDINITYKDGRKVNVPFEKCVIKGYDKDRSGKQKVYIEYKSADTKNEVLRSSVFYIVSATISKPTVKSMAYNKIKITWSCTYKFPKYDVYRVYSNGKKVLIAKNVKVKEYVDTCSSGVYYSYYVTPAASLANSLKINIAKSVTSNKVRAIVNECNVTKATSKSFKENVIEWSKVAGANGYYVYRKSKGGAYIRIATITNGNTTKYTDKKAVLSTTYVYAVKAYRKVGDKSLAGNLGKTKSVTTRLGTVSISSVKKNSSHTTISFRKVAGASRYEIYYCSKRDGTYKRAGVVSSNNLKFNHKVKASMNYYYKVRAVKIVKVNGVNKKIYGSFSSIKSR